MEKVLKFLFILQEVPNEDRKLGRGFYTATRFNPWNPLSYVAYLLIFIAGILMFGFVGVWKQSNFRNPFKWQ